MTPLRFHPRLLDCWRQASWRDVGAGLTVGIIALPLAMAFAIASGLKPEAGLTTAIIAGFLISLLGGSNVQIGGPAGAFIVVVYGIVERHGLGGLALATFMAGLLLVAMGLLRLGALVRQIPISIVIGFTNGIAVLIALSQLRDLLGLHLTEKLPADFFAQIQVLVRHAGSWTPEALALGLLCVAILALWPRLTRLAPTRVDEPLRTRALQSVSRLPGPIVALVALSSLASWLHWPVETIGSRFGHIPQGFPPLQWPDLSWGQAKLLVTPTLTLAFLGAIESLLCARVADKAAPDLPPHDPNQELLAQGVANLASPLLGGMPATGTIARTVTNIRAGARTPIAGLVHAITVAAIMALAAPLALQVPLSVLAGILLFMAWNMGEWHEFARLRNFSVPYRTVLVGTFVLTVVFDLTVAVEIGLLLACAFFIYRMGTLFRIVPIQDRALPPGVQGFELYGSLFFGAAGKLEALPAMVNPSSRRVVLDLHRLVQLDTSGLDALQQLWRTLERRGVGLILADVNEQPLSLIRRSGFESDLGAESILPNLADPKIGGFPDR
ncbi:SulP family inorganic anion transporter [Inhella gelatinilytica]|uniref:STAS domain-containing protein n=1 Tax=Inhella gelatinilytica TaxID=2795030 RepID=A0A931IYV9_9BURK|nr:SulP family inorganic anion transporter [Inhella gelatinilytica]MBH9553530.1 STAS domain-containing protein [Inhella gelatinilytica]